MPKPIQTHSNTQIHAIFGQIHFNIVTPPFGTYLLVGVVSLDQSIPFWHSHHSGALWITIDFAGLLVLFFHPDDGGADVAFYGFDPIH